MLFGLLARAEIAHRDGLVRLAAEVDLAQDHFDRQPMPSRSLISVSTGRRGVPVSAR